MNDKHQEYCADLIRYCIEKAEFGGIDFPTFSQWLNPAQFDQDRKQAIEDQYQLMLENDTLDLY